MIPPPEYCPPKPKPKAGVVKPKEVIQIDSESSSMGVDEMVAEIMKQKKRAIKERRLEKERLITVMREELPGDHPLNNPKRSPKKGLRRKPIVIDLEESEKPIVIDSD